MQKRVLVHCYFGKNKEVLIGFVIFSIMSGTSYMLWSFLFEQASGFAGGTVDTTIQQLCLSVGLCMLHFVVSQQLMFYFCKLRSNGMPVPLLRNCYSIFNGTKYR